MSTISLRLSESLHSAARLLADREEVSINQLISTALAEKISALAAEEMVLERARKGDRAKFLAALDKSPAVPDKFDPQENPMSYDSILENQSVNDQSIVKQLEKYLLVDGVEKFATKTQGGDLRYRIDNGIVAEIKFFKKGDYIDLRLYFPPDTRLSGEYKMFEQPNSKQVKYDRRLNTNEPIPDDVIRNIAASREFIRSK